MTDALSRLSPPRRLKLEVGVVRKAIEVTARKPPPDGPGNPEFNKILKGMSWGTVTEKGKEFAILLNPPIPTLKVLARVVYNCMELGIIRKSIHGGGKGNTMWDRAKSTLRSIKNYVELHKLEESS